MPLVKPLLYNGTDESRPCNSEKLNVKFFYLCDWPVKKRDNRLKREQPMMKLGYGETNQTTVIDGDYRSRNLTHLILIS